MRLFVANFPDEADEETLRGLFAEFGKVVSVKIIKDYETGKRRGFAFVSMPVKYQAERAMKRLDSTDLMGRELAVREARKSVRNRRSGKDRRKRQNPSYKGPERRKNERRGSERRRMRRRD